MKQQSVKLIKRFIRSCHSLSGLFLFLIVIFSVSFCNSSTGKRNIGVQQKISSSKADAFLDSASGRDKYKGILPTDSTRSFPYNLNNPDERYLLPNYLKEISGLAYSTENGILCIQDEKADIYVLNLDKKKIVNKYNFGRDGDYEDIAVIGKTAFLLRSDGKIFEVENFDSEYRKVTEHKTPLSAKNNTEGLTYDKTSNSLFIACKGSPSVKKDNPFKGYKAIYKFDLGEMKLYEEPDFLVDLNRSDRYKDEDVFRDYSLRTSKKRQLVENQFHIEPSGIAIHPVFNEIYLISSLGKILIVLDRSGKVSDLQELSSKLFLQPEGICFSPAGDMFISSEGRGGEGYILRFSLQPNK